MLACFRIPAGLRSSMTLHSASRSRKARRRPQPAAASRASAKETMAEGLKSHAGRPDQRAHRPCGSARSAEHGSMCPTTVGHTTSASCAAMRTTQTRQTRPEAAEEDGESAAVSPTGLLFRLSCLGTLAKRRTLAKTLIKQNVSNCCVCCS